MIVSHPKSRIKFTSTEDSNTKETGRNGNHPFGGLTQGEWEGNLKVELFYLPTRVRLIASQKAISGSFTSQ
jgi:hypothetical protein